MTVLRGLTIAGVPVLLGVPQPPNRPLPVVLWFHGFRADALAHAQQLERCSDAGFLAVGVDAIGHGARRDEQLSARVAESDGHVMQIMREQIALTIVELPALVEALVRDFGADRTRVSVVGTSMGAFLAYELLASSFSVHAAVALLGSPMHVSFDALVHACDRTALLSITAEHDVNVSPDAALALHARLGDDARHHILRGSGHLTSREHWHEAMELTFVFLDRHAR